MLLGMPARADDHADDYALGRSVYAELLDKGQIVDDSPYDAVVQRVGRRIAAASGKQWFTERFYIVRGNQINAFSAPGGFVFVNEYDLATGVAHYGFLNFTRDQEYAADVFGADLAARAGFDPWGTVWFFQSVEHVDGDAGYEQYLQHHPSTSDRVTHIERHFASEPARFGHYRKAATGSSGFTRNR